MNDHTPLEVAIVAFVFLVFDGFGWWLVWHDMLRSSPTIVLFRLFILSHLFGGVFIIIYLALHTAICGFSTTLSLFLIGDMDFLFRTGTGFLMVSPIIAIWLALRNEANKAKNSAAK